MLEAERSIDWRTYVIALLGGEGGLRVGEIVALEWSDIDLERRSPLGLARPAHEPEERQGSIRGDDRACGDGSPQASAPSQFTRAVPTGAHILRHTFRSHLVMRGAAMRAVQELVGHQDLTMTQRYSHLSRPRWSTRFGCWNRE